MGFQTSPDFKGIKTLRGVTVTVSHLFQTSPDFKGIKTHIKPMFGGKVSFKPALISKGLRPFKSFHFRPPIVSNQP